MGLDGAQGDHEPAGDLLVGGAVGGEGEDLALAVAERRRLEALARGARDDREAHADPADGDRQRGLGVRLPDDRVDAVAQGGPDGTRPALVDDGHDVALEALVAGVVEQVDGVLGPMHGHDERAGVRPHGVGEQTARSPPSVATGSRS